MVLKSQIGIACLIAATACAAMADENSDLSLIPESLGHAESTGSRSSFWNAQFFAENAVTGYGKKSSLPVPVPYTQPDWQDRLSLDFRGEGAAGSHVKFHLSDRLNFFAQDNITLATEQSARNSLREIYVSSEILPRAFFEAGRINLRNGCALGFNPTDFFKTRSLVTQASIDPSALRNNRLGTVMAQTQTVWDGGSASFAYAPRLQSTSGIAPQASFDPGFGQTNDQNRWFASVGLEVADLSPQFVFYKDTQKTKGGVNITHAIGNSIVSYVEWSGGMEKNLSQRAVEFGQATHELPSYAPVIPQAEAGTGFKNDLAVGASWTHAATRSSKLTLNLEYHFHQAGLDASALRNWGVFGANAILRSELWYVRQYAQNQQEPWAQQEFFWRLDWPDGLINHLDLNWLGFISPIDGSSLHELSASYGITDSWTFEGFLNWTLGGPTSVYGGLPQLVTGIFQLRLFF